MSMCGRHWRVRQLQLQRLPCKGQGAPAVDTGATADDVHFVFGVIADIQYADRADGTNFAKTVTRRYRNALEITKTAVADWNAYSTAEGVPGWGASGEISFVAQLGDLIDGVNKAAGASESALRTVLSELHKAPTQKFIHLIGNHELYNFSRQDITRFLAPNPPGGALPLDSAYYAFSPHPQWSIVVLDPFDISTLAPSNGDVEEAYRMLALNNPNDVRASGNFLDGLEGIAKRWVPYNGAIGQAQLMWLEKTLEEAQKAPQRVVILSHVGVCPGSTNDSTLIWNYEPVLDMCSKYTCVCAFMCGHDHSGGYKNENGVHHITVQSPLECEVGETAYGIMVVRNNSLTLCGSGKVPTREMSLRPWK